MTRYQELKSMRTGSLQCEIFEVQNVFLRFTFPPKYVAMLPCSSSTYTTCAIPGAPTDSTMDQVLRIGVTALFLGVFAERA
jgi:hypothetical protein